MIVGTVIVCMFIMGISRMRIGSVRIVMMFDLVATWMARMRANDRDGSRNDGADQRQENDCLDHIRASLRMISAQTRFAFVAPENRSPLFRIMRYPFIRLTSSTAIEPRLRK